MFSQWAAKRVCKFFLKRLLGRVIRGEVDLDRLDVQLGSGIIQLSDLALNSDYLNEQLGATPVIVKEGSIGSISIQIPWKALSVEKCEIELEELEIVLTPRLEVKTPRRNEDCSNSEVERLSKASSYWHRSEQEDGCGAQNGGSTYLGVHDGVKMIAKMVERLLLGLRVRIKNLIIAFEQGTLTCESHLGSRSSCQSQSILVLRVPQTEYGTEISEDDHENPVLDSNNSTELAILTKIIRFQGATLDLYDVEEEEAQSETLRSFVSIFSGKAAGRQPSYSPIPVIDGNDGGFTGLVQLSIPWKSGCVEIPKVDIEISIHPLKLRLEPCIIQRMIFLLHSFHEYGEVSSESSTSSKNAQTMGQKFGPSSSNHGPDVLDIDTEMFSSCAESLLNSPQQIMEETTNSIMLPVTMFIPDWVHAGISGAQTKGGAEDDTDLGASVDEFFECFDATRSSHASLANSNLWNWTCSVFTAVTAASTLASGSLYMPSGQQRVEYNLKGRLSSVSVMLTFEGQHWSHRSELQKNHGDGEDVEGTGYDNCLNECRHAQQLGGSTVSPANSHIDAACSVENSSVGCWQQKIGCWDDEESYLEASFQDLDFSLQVSAHQVKLKTMVKQFEIYEHVLDAREKDMSFSLSNCEQKYGNNMNSISCLQTAVEDALPPFPLSLYTPGEAHMVSEMRIEDAVLSQEAVSSKSWNKKECSTSTLKKMVKIKLLTSMSDSTHHFSLSRHLSSVNCGDLTTSCTKIDAQLQPFVLWVDVYMVNKLWRLIKGIENPYDKFSKTSDDKFAGERLTASHDPSFQKVSDETRKVCFSQGGMDVQQGIVQGNIHISCGRIILSFPIDTNRGLSPHLLRDSFLCINLSEYANLQNGQPGRLLKHDETSLKDSSFPSSSFINLNVGECGLFLVSPPKRNNAKRNSSEPNEPFLFARKIFSVTKEKEWDYSTISIQWQLVAGTGPWIATRAWDRATTQQARGNGTRRDGGNNSEFAAATAAGALEDIDSHIRQDMILSSSLFIHFSLPHAQLDLYGSEHIKIGNLLSLLTDSISCENMQNCLSAVGKPAAENFTSSSKGRHLRVSQSSILLECRAVDISIHLEEPVDAKAWMDKELPGSWESFRLTVQNFEVLSVSNLGSIAGDSYLWITHDEGELRGSLSDIGESSSETVKDLFLLCCKNDARGRGDGGGSNALAAGNAGTTITYLSCSERLRSLTTVSIRCGTFVAPGGRLDWLVAVISFFNQSTNDEHQTADTCPQEGLSTNDNVYCTSFLLDLLDVAVSYEPATTGSSTILGVESRSHSPGNLSEESYAPVGCILAAASVSLSNETISNTVSKEYMISLQDVGLLLLDLAMGRSDKYAYGTESLRCNGYVKIAREALMGLAVKTNCEDGLQWKVECSDNHICLDTCHDTTAALSRLVAQLQQIFAPDIEESVMHLQTRHGDGKQASTAEVYGESVDDTVIIEKCGYVSDASNENLDGNHTCGSTLAGLMDGIMENAFSLGGDLKGRVENDKASGSPREGQINILQCGPLLDGGTLQSATYGSAFNISPSGKEKLLCESTSGIPAEDVHVPSLQKARFRYIEDYYISESYSGSHISESKHSKVGESVRAHKTSIATAEDIVDGRGGWYKDSSLRVWENHISKVNCQLSDKSQCKGDEPCSSSRILNLAGKNSQSVGCVLLRNFNIKWSMWGGSDWPTLRKYDCLLAQGECGRNASSCLEVMLQGVDFQYDSFPEGGIHASKLAVSIHDLRIFDHSKDAPWKMVLGYYHSKRYPRESSAKALKLELEAVKPDPSTPLEEYRLLVELLPLRLHLDQGQLDFLIKFFSPKASSPALQMQPADDRTCCRTVAAHTTDSRGQSAAEEALLPFFQKCEIWPVIIRVDYVPRRIDLAALRAGNYAELLNLFSWKGIDLHLKHVHAVGVHGWSSISGVVIGEWLEDISRNQVHKLIKGLAPVRSLFAVGSGAAKLVVLPAEHYKRDRRLLRGMRKGAIAFLRSISLEAVGLGVHLAAGAHELLIHTESALGGISPSSSLASRDMAETAGKTNQPKDAWQGIQQACESLIRGLERTASSLIGNPMKVYRHGAGAGPAVASAFRAVPAAALVPASAAAGAVHCTLLGVRNSLDPDRKRESEEKHSGPPPVLKRGD